MNASIFVTGIYIFVILTSNLNVSLPAPKNEIPLPEHSNSDEDGTADKLLQQSIELLQKWLTFRTDRMLGKITQVDGTLHRTILDNQQSNIYKFDLMSNSITAMQQHIAECKQMQQEMRNQKVEVLNYVVNVRNMMETFEKIKSKLETSNTTLENHMTNFENTLKILNEKMNSVDNLDFTLNSFKDKTLQDLQTLNDQINQQDEVVNKLKDFFETSTKNAAEIEIKMQENMETIRETITGLKNELQDEKSSSIKEIMKSQSDQFKRELNVLKKKMCRQMMNVNSKLSTAIQLLNSTVHTNYEVNKKDFEVVEKFSQSVVNELNMMKLAAKNVNSYRERIIFELKSQKQEMSKHSAVINAVKKDIDVLVAYVGLGTPLPVDKYTNKKD